MKRIACLLALLVSGVSFARDDDKFNPAIAKAIAPFADAVGVVKTYPFANKNQFVSCTTFHIGEGWMVTAGHCFLGMESCQNAVVEFSSYKKKQGQPVLKGACQSVLSSRGDDWEISGPHEDYAIFKTDIVPAQKLDIDFSPAVVTGAHLVTLMYPRPKSGDEYTAILNETCSATKSVATTPQGFILSPRSFEHNCGSAGGAQGAPLISQKTGKVVGIHQGHGIVNVKQLIASNGLTGLGYAKLTTGSRLKTDVLVALGGRVGSRPRTFDSIVVGGFSQFAFPGAIFDQVSAKVVTLEARNPQVSNQVSFRAITGPETAATIVDGNNSSFTISGTMWDTLLESWSLPAPVTIFVGTPEKASSVYLQIRDIR